MQELSTRIWNIWNAGGWTMIPLCLLSLLIYGTAARLLVYFSQRKYKEIAEATWLNWIRQPGTAEGEVGEIIRYTQDEVESLDDIHSRFTEVISAKLPWIDRSLSTLGVLVAAAPLLGLLGTVFGMLVTFQALAVGGGKVTDMMAAGISQALFPPEVGLCIALPGLMIIQLLKRKRQEYEAFLAWLESCTIQHHKSRMRAPVPRKRTQAEPRIATPELAPLPA